MTKSLFVTGIGTGVGKTVGSAVLCKAFNADYWKPIQAGDLKSSDSIFVQQFSQTQGKIWPERYALKYAMAPHKAAELEGVRMELSDLHLPDSNNKLIIEGAGGCAVPINEQHTYLDFIQKQNLATVLVVNNYLGSINHTLLSIEALKARNIDLKGIILIGSENQASEKAYTDHGGVQILGRIPWAKKINQQFIAEAAAPFKELESSLF